MSLSILFQFSCSQTMSRWYTPMVVMSAKIKCTVPHHLSCTPHEPVVREGALIKNVIPSSANRSLMNDKT